jgi:hypothetical protein
VTESISGGRTLVPSVLHVEDAATASAVVGKLFFLSLLLLVAAVQDLIYGDIACIREEYGLDFDIHTESTREVLWPSRRNPCPSRTVQKKSIYARYLNREVSF